MSSIVLIAHFFSFLTPVFRRFSYSCFAILFLLSGSAAAADNLQAREYLIKSAFLYNFARLSQWPDNTFKSSSAPFKICIMGNDSFGLTLNSIRNKKINGHPLLIQRRVSLEQAAQCQLVFISRSEESKLKQILAFLTSYPVMTVSELADFAQQNGHIRLFLNDENTLSLEINLQAVRASQLKISSRILTLATIVQSDNSTEDDNE